MKIKDLSQRNFQLIEEIKSLTGSLEELLNQGKKPSDLEVVNAEVSIQTKLDEISDNNQQMILIAKTINYAKSSAECKS